MSCLAAGSTGDDAEHYGWIVIHFPRHWGSTVPQVTVDGHPVGHFGVSPIVCEVEAGVHIVEACVIDAHPLRNGRRFLTSAYVEVFPGQTIECSYTRLWSGRLTPGRYEAEAARDKELQARLLIACSPLLALGLLALISILLNIFTEIV